MTTQPRRMRRERIEVRSSHDERALIAQAVAARSGGLTTFVMNNLTVAAQRVLADRTAFVLDAEGRSCGTRSMLIRRRDPASASVVRALRSSGRDA